MTISKHLRFFLAGLLIMTQFSGAQGRIKDALVAGSLAAGSIIGVGSLIYFLNKKRVQNVLTKTSQDILYKFEEGKPEIVALAPMLPQERESHITKHIDGLKRDELIVYYQQVLYDRFVLRSMIERNAVPNRMESIISYLGVVDEIVLHSYRSYYKAWYEKIAEDSYFATDNHISWKITARYPQAPDGEMRVYQLLIVYRDALQKIIDLLLTKPVHPDRDSTLNGAEVLLRRIDTDLELMSKNPIIAKDMAARKLALTVQKAALERQAAAQAQRQQAQAQGQQRPGNAPGVAAQAPVPGAQVPGTPAPAPAATGFDKRRALKWAGIATATLATTGIAVAIIEENHNRRENRRYGYGPAPWW